MLWHVGIILLAVLIDSINYLSTNLYSIGVCGVVRDGLSNAWIPNGWTWGGVVSDHCPVYSQLYSKVDLDREEINVADVKFLLGSSSHGT